jgi:hypothetical protein
MEEALVREVVNVNVGVAVLPQRWQIRPRSWIIRSRNWRQ